MRNFNLEYLKCRGGMEQGYVLDRGDYDARRVARWIEGAPERSFWMGLSLKNRRQLETATYRCTNCGYLEAYAK